MDRDKVIYLSTCQFVWGGLLDAVAADEHLHLVRDTLVGPLNLTLCGIDRFAEGGPGFNVGGGVSKHHQVHTFCPGCVEVAKRDHAGLLVSTAMKCDFAAAGLAQGDGWQIREDIYAKAGAL